MNAHGLHVARIGDQLEQPRPFVNFANVTAGFQHLESVVDSVSRVASFVDEHALGRTAIRQHLKNRFVGGAEIVRVHRFVTRMCAAHVQSIHSYAISPYGQPIRTECADSTTLNTVDDETRCMDTETEQENTPHEASAKEAGVRWDPPQSGIMVRREFGADHVHVNAWNGESSLIIGATTEEGEDLEVWADFTPEQARRVAAALYESADFAEAEKDADLLLENDGDDPWRYRGGPA